MSTEWPPSRKVALAVLFLMIGVILTTRAVLVRPTWVRTYESEDKDLWCWAVALDGQRVVAFGSDWIGGLDGKLGWLLRVYDQKGTLLWSRTHTRWGIAGDARAAGHPRHCHST